METASCTRTDLTTPSPLSPPACRSLQTVFFDVEIDATPVGRIIIELSDE